ncbi:MAG: alpha-amylase family glycosyl hydrolase [Paracoccaceae bacterium]|nr:alpha-amylase family glycosyl hydrolase [Paracoccaceae bacterium]
MDKAKDDWWRGACLYEVYLRSFQDTNRDGEGDLAGLAQRLEYLADLGVDGIWITPFFPSPMRDSGYDVSDYRAVDPRFGTLNEFRALTEKAHSLDLRVVIDQVYSHSSNQHPWFIESSSSRNSPKADWYVWADAKSDGSPPNNWLARFGGIAWEWSAERKQYYLHNFLTEQPDLNLHNPEVQDEVLDIMRFWFDLGVDGLRLDVANFFMHDPELRDNPPAALADLPANPYYLQQRLYDRSRPENLPFLERMREVAGDRMLLAEISCDWQVERMAEYTQGRRLHTAYSFEFLGPTLDGNHISRSVEQAGTEDSWPTWAFSNHDVPRVASRWGSERVKVLQALLLCLRGSVILYQGEELGLPQSDVPREHLQDPEAIRFWPNHRGRDGARSPMAWENTPGLGFSDAQGWLPAEPAHAPLAVSEQIDDPSSPLAHCRDMLSLRREAPALRLGEFETVEADTDGLTFWRRYNGQSVLCSFNFGDTPRATPITPNGKTLAGEHAGGQIAPYSYWIAEAAP